MRGVAAAASGGVRGKAAALRSGSTTGQRWAGARLNLLIVDGAEEEEARSVEH